jgi:hypothetical protein
MSIEDIFPSAELSSGETQTILEVFSNPTVKKYLRNMAAEDTKELLSLAAISKTSDEIATAHAIVQGKLFVLSTLLSIAAQPSKEQ